MPSHTFTNYDREIDLFKTDLHFFVKNMETLINASKEVGLEVNTKETKYMLLFRYHNAGKS
jgi:hypothetical protein